MSQELFEARLAKRIANPWFTALASLPLLGVLGLLIGWAVTGIPMFVGAPHLLIFSAVLHLMNLQRKPRERRVPAMVRASSTELRVGDREIARARITRALYLPPLLRTPPTVRVERKRRLPIELVVHDEQQGRQLLRALGMDAAQSVASFRGMSRAMGRPWLMSVGFFAIMPVIFAFAWLLPQLSPLSVPLLIGLAMTLALFPSRIEIGADGVLVKWMWLRRFIPTSDIAGVGHYAQSLGQNKYVGAKLTLRSGEEVNLPIGNRWSDALAYGLVERIREAVDVYKRGDVESAAALLDRRDRTIPQWIAMLKGVGAGAATLRTAAIDTERLWHLLESAGAPPKQRAAAAIALSSCDEQDAKARIRIAANAVAEPKLRVVLEAASQSDEAAIEQAMQELDEVPQEREARARG